MQNPTMMPARQAAPDTTVLPAYLPLPLGLLPVNAFLIRSREPVLVDTGLAALEAEFMDQLRTAIDPQELRWVWLTHTDPDHLGALDSVLAAAPHARVVTTFLGMGKMGLHRPLPPDRVFLLNPGQRLDVGDRELTAVKPPTFDAPETTGLVDTRTGALFSADCFGALLRAPSTAAEDVGADDLRDGLVTWATVDAPWLDRVDPALFGASLEGVRQLEPTAVLSSHLPPAPGKMTGTLLGHLDAAREAPPFVGPDQEALRSMLAAA